MALTGEGAICPFPEASANIPWMSLAPWSEGPIFESVAAADREG